MAYVALPILKVSTLLAPRSMSKPPEPCVAELTASMVPFSRTRTSWTPWSWSAAIIAYASPFISNASTSEGPLSVSNAAPPGGAGGGGG